MGIRAAVLIGVDRCGDLEKLSAASAGARQMERWARSQKIDRIEPITDEGGQEVSVHRIKKAVQKLTADGDVSQLLVYFAGHGINIGRSEYWLLSDAIGDPNEAVNVRGSELLARYGSVPHVVFFSDACRTAAEGIRAQAVTGSEIFRNEEGDGRARWVDQFYASLLGRPAHEIKDPKESAALYEALYTESLVEILSGAEPGAIDVDPVGGGFVRPKPLKKHIETRMLDRLVAKGLDLEVVQTPDAVITSEDSAWLSKVSAPPLQRSGPGTPPRAPTSPIDSLRRASSAGLAQILGDEAPRRTRGPGAPADRPQDAVFSAAVERESRSFGPTRFETDCGFKIRGAKVARALAVHSKIEILGDELVRVTPSRGPDDLVLELADGRGVLLPVIPQFLGALTFEDDELVNLVYEPSEGAGRWFEYQDRREELARLRALVAESARHGVFRLEGDNVLRLANGIRVAKGFDPTMAIYAAYAYHELHRVDLIAGMAGYLHGDLGLQLFDVALLAGRLERERGDIHPFLPLLTQGWALLNAYQVRLPAGLEKLREHLLPSLWTLFDPGGTRLVTAEIQRRKAGR